MQWLVGGGWWVGGSRFPAAAVEGVGRVCRVVSRVVGRRKRERWE